MGGAIGGIVKAVMPMVSGIADMFTGGLFSTAMSAIGGIFGGSGGGNPLGGLFGGGKDDSNPSGGSKAASAADKVDSKAADRTKQLAKDIEGIGKHIPGKVGEAIGAVAAPFANFIHTIQAH